MSNGLDLWEEIKKKIQEALKKLGKPEKVSTEKVIALEGEKQEGKTPATEEPATDLEDETEEQEEEENPWASMSTKKLEKEREKVLKDRQRIAIQMKRTASDSEVERLDNLDTELAEKQRAIEKELERRKRKEVEESVRSSGMEI